MIPKNAILILKNTESDANFESVGKVGKNSI
jgi:hypothetical protein